MNSRPKFLLPASLVAAALACSACGGARELQTADPAALVPASARLLAPEAPSPEAERRAFTPVVAPSAGLELAETWVNEKNEKLKYKAEFSFPQLKGRLTPHAEKFNRAVRALVARELRDFRPTAADFDDKFLKDGYASRLRGEYEFTHFADDLIGLRFTLFVDNGGANSVQLQRALNFDLKGGRTLKLGDLFRPGARHLRALADYCIADLKRQDGEHHRRSVGLARGGGRPHNYAGSLTPDSEFQIGAGPEADNYRAWNLAADGVVVTFAKCQVGGCADGEKEVLVPYAALDAMLNQSSPAARLFARQPR